MKQTINFSQFCDSLGGSYFSHEGKKALFEYLENEVKLDPIALCCEYSEYDNLKELQNNYNNIETIEELKDHMQVIPIYDINGTKSERFIVQNY